MSPPRLHGVTQSVLDLGRVPVGTTAGGGFSIAIAIRKWLDRFWIWIQTVLIGKITVAAWQRLAFVMQGQQQTQWCWAANATSVAAFYDPSTTWTQCGLVNDELGQSTCCSNGGSSACNKPWYLDKALQRVGHLDTWSSGAATFGDVRTEIDSGRPLGVRIGWSGGGGHFLMIDGYLDDTTHRVAVDDPWFGASDITYATLVSSYQGSGSWTHSYETQP